MDEPCSEVVTTAGSPRAAASSRWRKVKERPVLDLDLTRQVGVPEPLGWA